MTYGLDWSLFQVFSFFLSTFAFRPLIISLIINLKELFTSTSYHLLSRETGAQITMYVQFD